MNCEFDVDCDDDAEDTLSVQDVKNPAAIHSAFCTLCDVYFLNVSQLPGVQFILDRKFHYIRPEIRILIGHSLYTFQRVTSIPPGHQLSA